jgi:pimeloyl-ACP methyl ester carboxylesterase
MELSTTRVDVPGGEVALRDTGGQGPPVMFIHGALVDGRLWDLVWPSVAAAGYRCLLPDLPLGGHRIALDPGADRTPYGQVARIATLVEGLDAGPVVIVGNDTGGALSQMLAARRPELVDRLILTSSDAFRHFPPKMFKVMPLLAHSPRALKQSLKLIGSAPLRNTPLGFGLISKRPVPTGLMDEWLAASDDPGVLNDLAGFVSAVRSQQTVDAAEALRKFPRPALMAWSVDDPLFPYGDAEKLAAMIPAGRLVPIPDSYCFSMLDNPEAVSAAIVDFLGDPHAPWSA